MQQVIQSGFGPRTGKVGSPYLYRVRLKSVHGTNSWTKGRQGLAKGLSPGQGVQELKTNV